MSIFRKIREANPVDLALIVALLVLAGLPIVGLGDSDDHPSAPVIESPATPEGRVDTGTLVLSHGHDANSICAREECDHREVDTQ